MAPSSAAGTYLVTFQGDNLSGNLGATYTQIVITSQNDDFVNATLISFVPFSATENAINSTSASDDPYACYGTDQTVWYRFTPSQDMRLEANTFGSDYDTTLSVYTGSRGALTQVGCNDDSPNGTVQSRVRFDAVAGTTYYFMAAALYPSSPATLVFNVVEAPPPLTVTPVISHFGTVKLTTGTATLSGNINVSQPSFVTILRRAQPSPAAQAARVQQKQHQGAMVSSR